MGTTLGDRLLHRARRTTLKKHLRILDRLHPKKIVIVSSAPQIRYPDYYGIDMPHLEEFCVFRATMELTKRAWHGRPPLRRV